MMEISALTRSVIKKSHALICPDGYINSTVPGWTNCTVNVIISREMGAGFSQTLVTCQPGAILTGLTQQVQTFFNFLSGKMVPHINAPSKKSSQGNFVSFPEWQ